MKVKRRKGLKVKLLNVNENFNEEGEVLRSLDKNFGQRKWKEILQKFYGNLAKDYRVSWPSFIKLKRFAIIFAHCLGLK